MYILHRFVVVFTARPHCSQCRPL